MTAHNRPFWRRLAQAAAKPATVRAAASAHTAPAGLVSPMRPLALEQRFMFDGAGAADAAHAVTDGAMASDAATDTAGALRHALMAEAPAVGSPRQEITFIDGQVQDYQQLLAGIKPGTEVVVLDPKSDGLKQISGYLAGRSGIDAIHIVSHGLSGQVTLGSLTFDKASLDARATDLAQIGQSLDVDGDILFYGCDVGSGAAGQAFINQIAQFTGADVAASNDVTGSTSQGGDWTLEVSSGSIEAVTPFSVSAQQAFGGRLFAGTLNFSGPDTYLGMTVTDGQANSIDIPGVVIESYSADSGNTNSNSPWEYYSTFFGPNSDGIVDSSGDGTPIIIIRSQNGADFSFTGIKIVDYLGTHPQITFEAFRDGVSQGSVTLATDSLDYISDFTQSNGLTASIFQNVDEIRISDPSSGNGNLYVALDNIGFADVPRPALVSATFSDNNLKIGETSSVTFTFNMAVTGFTTADLIVPNGSINGLSSSDGGLTWTGLFTPDASVTDSTNVITVNLSGVTGVSTSLAGIGAADSSNYAIDTLAPSVTSVTSSTANGTYKAGDVISVQVSFFENVTVTGTPQLTLETGSTDRVINYTSGSGTNTLTFSYTVQAGDASLDLDYISIGALALNGGTVRDAAGNDATLTLAQPGTSGSLGANKSLIIDAVPPTTTVSSLNFSNDTGSSGSDFITNVASQTISGTLSANLQSGETVYVSINNGATWTAASATVGQNSWSLAGVTLSTSSTLRVKVSDAAGNDGTVHSQSYTYDTTSPTTSFSGLTFSNDSGTFGDFITNNASQTITATLSASLAAGDVLHGSLDGGNTWSDITSKVSGTTLSWNGVTLAGSGSLQLRVMDAAGNTGPVRSQAYVLDTGVPSAPSTPILNGASDTGISNGDGITSDTTPTFTGVAESGSTVKIYDGATLLGSVTATGGTWSYTTTTLSEGSHSITATATDAAGNVSAASAGRVVTIDATAPSVSMVVVPANATYFTGDTLSFSVSFSESVTVDTAGGTPRIALTVGSSTRYASYVSGSGSSTLVFSYTVVNGDTDSDGITVGALSANGGTLKDAAGNDATLTLNSVGSTAAVLVDGVQPGITSVSATTSDGSYGAGQTIFITVSFSTAVDVSTTNGLPTLALSSGGVASYTGGSGSATLTFSYTVAAGQNSADLDVASTHALQLNGATISEAGGSHSAASIVLAAPGTAGSLGANKAIVVDTSAPTASVQNVSFSSDTGPSSSDLVTSDPSQTISGTLSASLGSGEYVEISLDNGNSWQSASSSANSWSLAGQTLTGSGTLQVRVSDAAGNHGAAFSAAYVLDQTAPTVSITSSASSLKAGESATITFTFSEPPVNFRAADLTVSGGVISGFSATANPLVYVATFTPTAGVSNGSAVVSVAGGGYTDVAGNLGYGAASVAIAVDTLTPSLAISSNVASLKAGETALITFTFSEAPRGFDSGDVSVQGGVLSGWAATANPLVYTAVLTPVQGVDSGSLTVTVAPGSYTDAAGNPGQGGSTPNIAYDTLAPSATVVSVRFSDDTGVSSSDLITRTASQTIDGMLSAPLVSGESVQVSLDGGATWMSAGSVGSDSWSLGVVLTGSGVLQVRVVDAAGNAAAAFYRPYVLDQSPPTVVISSNVATVNGVTPALITFTFSEHPMGFSAGNITVSGGTLSGLTATSNPLVYTATYTPVSGVASGSATIAVNGYTDAAGNSGSSGAIPSLQIDTVAPSATANGVMFINDSGINGDLITNVALQTISGNLSAPLVAGDEVQISLDNGASWTIVPTGIGDTSWFFNATLNPGSNTLRVRVSDAAGNHSTVYAQAYAYDDTAPVATLTPLQTDSLTPTLTGTSALAAGDTMTVTVGGATYQVTPVSGAWSLDLATAVPISGVLALAAGQQYSVGIATLDVAGNQGSSSSTLTIRALPPTTPVTPSLPEPPIVPVFPSIPVLTDPSMPLAVFPPDMADTPIPGGPAAPWILPQSSVGSDIGISWPGQTPPTVLDTLPSFGPLSPMQQTPDVGLTSAEGFQIVALPGMQGSNAPVAYKPIPDVAASSGERIAVQISSDAFAYADGNAVVTLSARMADGTPLPGWLRFDARTGRFEGTPPPGFEGTLSVRVTVRDSEGRVATQVFKLVVSKDAGKTAFWHGDGSAPAGRASLSEQLRSARGAAARLAVLS